MIPRDFITAWRSEAPWIEDAQVEQDLVISRALVDIFSNSVLQDALAFRGGTALYKLFLKPAARYSEDIDLVQIRSEGAGRVMDSLHETLDSWLGAPKYRQSEGRVTFVYRFESEQIPSMPLRLKVEINTREHFSVCGFSKVPFSVNSRWFNGVCNIKSYTLNELMGTKLRALYQRKKGRDLFDLALALDHPDSSPKEIVKVFSAYMDHGGHNANRELLADNLSSKLKDKSFTADIGPLLAPGFKWSLQEMAHRVQTELIDQLP